MSDIRFLRWEDFGLGLTAVFQGTDQEEWRFGLSMLEARIDNIKAGLGNPDLDCTVEMAVLAEMNRQLRINTVNRKAESGELRLALSGLPSNVVESLVRAGVRKRKLHNRFVDSGDVRAALKRAGWPDDEIDYALYR